VGFKNFNIRDRMELFDRGIWIFERGILRG
jgi:hypothetical protein